MKSNTWDWFVVARLTNGSLDSSATCFGQTDSSKCSLLLRQKTVCTISISLNKHTEQTICSNLSGCETDGLYVGSRMNEKSAEETVEFESTSEIRLVRVE
ncbi:hypothetical protein BDV3_002807 [Batrachochytrium dendrobatidis]